MYFPRVVIIFEGYNHDSLYSGAKLCLSIRGGVKRVLSGGGEWSDAL